MSATRPSPTTPGAFLCPRCGSALHHDQDWCLECGFAARTRIHPPPGWRLPIVTTFVVLALLAAGIAFALVALLDTQPPAPTAATVTAPATAPAATVTTPATVGAPTTVTPTTSAPSTPAPGATTPTTTVTPATVVPRTTTTPRPAATPGGSQPPLTVPGTHLLDRSKTTR